MRKIKHPNSVIMKELMKHLPAIKNFIEERTQTLQEISDNMVKKFLTEAYKLPFLFPVRIIVSEEKFVNFLFDMRKELFEGKKIENGVAESSKQEVKTQEKATEEKQVETPLKKEKKVATKAKTTAKTNANGKVVEKKAASSAKNTKSKVVRPAETNTKAKAVRTKKEKISA